MVSNNFLETFDALDALYSENLIEAYDNARLETTYKGYKIYSYSVEHDYGHRDARGNHERYSTAYCFEHKDGDRQGGFSSIDACKKGIDTVLGEKDYEAMLAMAEKLVDTIAETYRGFEIFYARVIDAEVKPCKYSYKIETTRKSKWLGGEIEKKTFKSVDEAKKAIDACIDEYNAYADDKSTYKESLRRLIREALNVLDTDV